ncbi:hypothetical protein Bind_2293 [Beijerinckia indica subsp. indica ATCC 9039]|uniref:Uncharacterized protein n=1 Tax=Beijerinckia indica subsp. indica (strain ATCC 9039 / DSM 1715 / NCIMB 8712) TaxID=395963 RepID=B2IHC1_BEII9|nr:hypothetical protein Bind_2293 [Beijerinckia indica subsp. indica ATCC 9039]
MRGRAKNQNESSPVPTWNGKNNLMLFAPRFFFKLAKVFPLIGHFLPFSSANLNEFLRFLQTLLH